MTSNDPNDEDYYRNAFDGIIFALQLSAPLWAGLLFIIIAFSRCSTN